MKRIPLTRGKVALVDDEDYDWLSQWKWFAKYNFGKFYAARHDPKNHSHTIHMHQMLLGPRCDHKNRDGLDNRKENLRKASRRQNNCNQGLRKNNRTGYKGITCPDKRHDKYQARIGYKGRIIYLGYYETKEEAARAYDEAAKRLHGEFAVLNFTQPKRNTASL